MDEAAVIGHLCVLWMLPTAVFSAPGRSRGGAQGRQNRYNRIHHILRNKHLTNKLLSYVLQCQADYAPAETDTGGALSDERELPVTASDGNQEEIQSSMTSSDPAATPARSEDVRAAQRVEGFLRKGHTQRALRALSSTSTKADLQQTSERATLRQLHPTCPSNLPVCPVDAPAVVIDLDWMSREMTYSDTGAAPGLSGWGSNHLEVLATDTHCVTAIALIVQYIVNDALPATVRTILTTSCLVSLVKDDHGGRRPVAVGELLYRLAARYALSRVLHSAQKALRPHQFGLGEPDGCTQVVQSLQHLLTLPPARPPAPPRSKHQFAFSSPPQQPQAHDPSLRPLACLSIDISNAFNSINRAAVLCAAYANHDLAPSWRMIAFGYGQSSLLLMQCGTGNTASAISDEEAFIRSDNGVRQGDPLAALLFSLAMHSVYARLAELMHAGCFAFMDDGHGVGYLAECWKAWQLLPSLLEPLGLRLNPSKCELTCFHLDTAPQHAGDHEALRLFKDEGIKINERCLRVLGCVVGASDDCVAAELRDAPKFQVEQRVAFNRLPLMHKQTGMFALRHLTGTVLTNRLRAMTPASTAAHAAAYDDCVLRAAHHFVGISAADGDRYDEQLRWPLHVGGFGLTSAVDIAPAAYLAGLANTVQSSPTFGSMWRGELDIDPDWPLYGAITDSIRRVSHTEAQLLPLCSVHRLTNVSKSVLPMRADTFVQDIRALSAESCLLQSALTHRISLLSHIARVSQVEGRGIQGQAELARLNALTEKESSLWLRVLPTEAYLQLPDVKWQWCARFRLGMEMATCEEVSKLCEKHTEAAREVGGWHPMVCFSLSSAEINRRHHAVVNRIAHFSHVIHVSARTEPADLDPDAECRPDIQIELPDRTLLLDVTISHPNAKKWRHSTATRGVVAVGDEREAEKDRTYAPMTEALAMEFSAFVLYTYGGFHESALSSIRKLGQALDPATCLISHTKWKQALMEHIAVAVQRGNAEIMIRHSARLRGMTWPTRRRARSIRRYGGSSSIGSGNGRGGRSKGKAGVESSVAGARAGALAARLTPPSSVGELSSAAAGGAAHRVDGAADCEVDSDADTVQQETSPLEQMRVDTEAEVSLPSSSVEMVPDSPLGDTYDDKCAEVSGGVQNTAVTVQRRRPYGTGVLSGVMTTLARWSGVSGISSSLTGMRGDRESSGVSEDSQHQRDRAAEKMYAES
jgi:hypothetical protein